MEPRIEYIRQLVRERNWSGSELARQMGISRAEANRFLKGNRKGGKKIISGLLKTFPGETLETLFIFPTAEPNVNTNDLNATYKVFDTLPTGKSPHKQGTVKKTMKPVKHPNAHHLACCIDEKTGAIEIVDGKNVTTLLVPVGPIEIRHTIKHLDDTS